jgi:hypothetical protein
VRRAAPLTSFGVLVVVLLVAGCRQSEAPKPPPPPKVERQQDVPIYRERAATLDGYVNAQIQPGERIPAQAEFPRRGLRPQGIA